MARSQSSGALKSIGVGAAVIAGGAAIGYYLLGSVRDTHSSIPPAPTPAVSSTLTPPSIVPSSIHPHTANGDYTAPGAPHIVIEEERQPIIRRVSPPPAPASDPEASQEAAPTPPKPAAAETVPSDTTQPAPSPAETTPETDGGGSTPSPAAPTPAAPPSPPADPDFEHVNTPKPAPGASDPESGQQGGDKTQGERLPDPGKVQFRVQTGAYTDESSARSAADTLRSQGFTTSTRSERDGDHLVYKVQVGAYRSKVGADKAVGDLQKKGYAAYISPIGP